MLVSQFDFTLPKELIAHYPLDERSGSRMLVLNRKNGECECTEFVDFSEYLQPGDCIVVNNTEVIPARLFGNKQPGGAHVEVLLLKELPDKTWEALLRPGSRLKVGSNILLNDSKSSICVKKKNSDGIFNIAFSAENIPDLISKIGRMPLPPYINREVEEFDKKRYQTIFAANRGAIAAPTAGLHFDEKVIRLIKNKGVKIIPITLHIGLGTFKPVKTTRVNEHMIHSEEYSVTREAADQINEAKAGGGSIVAVGTSVVRVLETCVNSSGLLESKEGITNLFLHPPYTPRIVDKLLTNFHLPKSTLLMLVCTFANREIVFNAYRRAIKEKYRFFSYGDCMLFN